MVDWIGADVQKNSEHRTRPGKMVFAQDASEGHRQDARAAAVAELVGTPYFGAVLQELSRLQRYGVDPTPEMVQKAIKFVRDRFRPQPVFVPPAATHASPKKRRQPIGRFAGIGDVGEVVYYMRIGDRVKIGTSTNLRYRLETINPEELMALERGGVAIERERHRQFADLRTHGEWFRLVDPLIGHIESLRATE